MGFDAKEAAPDLTYDFSRYGGGKGTSPEPSNEALIVFTRKYRSYVDAFHRQMKAKMLAEKERLDAMTEADVKAEMLRLADLPFEELSAQVFDEQATAVPTADQLKRVREMCEMIAEVFQDIPTADDIEKLPALTKARYFGWVVGQLLSPELEAAATS